MTELWQCLGSRRVRSVAFWLTFAVAILIAAFYPWLARTWWDRPFPGFLVYRKQTVGVTMMGWWNGPKAGILAKDHILSVDGQPLTDTDWLYRYVAAKPLETPIRYEVERPGRSGPLTLTVKTQRFGVRDWLAYPVPFWWAALLHLLIGAAVSLRRPGYAVAQAHWLYCLAMFLNMISFFSVETTSVLGDLPTFGSLILIGATGINLALRFPRPTPLAQRKSWLLPVNVWMIAVGFLMAMLLLAWGDELVVSSVSLFCSTIGLLAILTSSVWACFSSTSSALDRSRARIVLIGAFLSFSPILLVIALIPARVSLDYPPLQFWAVGAFPLAIAYAILRHQLFDISFVLRRATVYALLTAGLAGLYALIVALGATLLLGNQLSGFVGALSVAVVIRPLYGWLRARVDRLFLGERADLLTMVADFRPAEPSHFHGIAEEILNLVRRAFDPVWAELRLDQTRLASISDGNIGEPVLVVSHRLNDRREVLLALGPKRNEMPYDGAEEASLKLLAAQAALALEHAGLYADKMDLLVEEGIARSLAEERRKLLMQILHDLRSDLFNITVAASRVERQSASGEALASIRRSLGRIETFLDDKLAGFRRATDVRAAMEGACRAMAPKLAAKEQHLESDLPVEPIEVGLSPVELEQVVLNLLDNASKFSPIGTRIHLMARFEEGEVVVRVEDEGPGIPDGLLDALATGRRADPAIPGSGLGLQNVKSLVDQCGGALSWGNRETGLRVEVRMPVVSGGRGLLEVQDGLGPTADA